MFDHEKFRAARKVAGLTQEKLAKLADVSRQALVKIELGQSKPTPAVRIALARALGLSPTSLEPYMIGQLSPLVFTRLAGETSGMLNRATLIGFFARASDWYYVDRQSEQPELLIIDGILFFKDEAYSTINDMQPPLSSHT